MSQAQVVSQCRRWWENWMDNQDDDQIMLIAEFPHLKSLNNGFWRSGFVNMLVIVWVLSLLFLSVLCLSVLSALLSWCGSLRNSDVAVLFLCTSATREPALEGRKDEGCSWQRTEVREQLPWAGEMKVSSSSYQIRVVMQVSTSERQEQQQSERMQCSGKKNFYLWQSPERFKSLGDFDVTLKSCALLWVLKSLTVWQFGFLKIV